MSHRCRGAYRIQEWEEYNKQIGGTGHFNRMRSGFPLLRRLGFFIALWQIGLKNRKVWEMCQSNIEGNCKNFGQEAFNRYKPGNRFWKMGGGSGMETDMNGRLFLRKPLRVIRIAAG